MPLHETVMAFAASRDWLSFGINLILSTIIGGIIIVILLYIATRTWGESVNIPNAFLLVFIINIINMFVLGFLTRLLPEVALLALPVLIWIVLVKAFFSEMRFWHVLVIGIIGYLLSIYIFPNIVSYVSRFLP